MVENLKKMNYTRPQLEKMVEVACKKYGFPVEVAKALIDRESSWNPRAQNKNTDGTLDEGLMQINNKYRKDWGISNPYDPVQSIDRGIYELSKRYRTYGGDLNKTLASYNAGVGAVKKATSRGQHPDSVTTGKNYSAAILQNAAKKYGYQGYNAAGEPIGAAANVSQPLEFKASNIQALPYIDPTTGQKIAGNAKLTQEDYNTAVNYVGGAPTTFTKAEMEKYRAEQQAQNDAYVADVQNQGQYWVNRYSKEPVAKMQDKDGNEILLTQKDLDDMQRQRILNDYSTAEANVQDMINPNSAANTKAFDTMYSRLQDAYNTYNQRLDERYANRGYSMNPDTLAYLNNLRGHVQLANTGTVADPLQAYLNGRQLQYEAQAANEYGIPFAEFEAYKKAQLAAEAAKAQQLGNTIGNEIDYRKSANTNLAGTLTNRRAITERQLSDIMEERKLVAALETTFGTQNTAAIVEAMKANNTFNAQGVANLINQGTSQRGAMATLGGAQLGSNTNVRGQNVDMITNANTVVGNIDNTVAGTQGKLDQIAAEDQTTSERTKQFENSALGNYYSSMTPTGTTGTFNMMPAQTQRAYNSEAIEANPNYGASFNIMTGQTMNQGGPTGQASLMSRYAQTYGNPQFINMYPDGQTY